MNHSEEAALNRLLNAGLIALALCTTALSVASSTPIPMAAPSNVPAIRSAPRIKISSRQVWLTTNTGIAAQ